MTEKKYDHKHVVPREEGWGVIDRNGLRASKVFKTKPEAEMYAKDLAKRHNVGMVVHDEEGKFGKFDFKPNVNDLHVIFKDNLWIVKEQGKDKIIKTFENKGEAMEYAYDLSKKHESCMIVHDKKGKFESVTCSPENTPSVLEVIRMKLKF
ncbi:MAG: DUF2188 domain-containing protein [Nanoarchaeota archaeon]|nr:DUF2188 domain-containing protein [Nanoarchaeota archaeon]